MYWASTPSVAQHCLTTFNTIFFISSSGVAASAKAAIARAVIVRTFCCSSTRPCSIISTKAFKCGRIAQPIRIAICCTILIPVWRACQDFFDLQTALRNGNNDGIPRAEATTANARAVVLRTYSSILSISGRIVEIIVAKPAALAKFEIISRPSTLA
uniref:Uncharacterized protein n=1 Tax=Glossina austeni TaxID=7395 RepID=A0A1A9UHZ7_GLOAU